MVGGWVDEWESGVLLFSIAFEEPLELSQVMFLLLSPASYISCIYKLEAYFFY